MLQRRVFLTLASVLGMGSYLKAEEKFVVEFQSVEVTITAVQNHMFPKDSLLPSSEALNLTAFMFETMRHKSFDRDIRDFVIDGAKELELQEKGKFTQLSFEAKEKALRKFERWHYGKSWLSRMMTLSMEGLFCDPIYTRDRKEESWNSLSSFGGFPRPSSRYIDV